MEFKFPDVGEGISEGTVVRWHVEEGDTVQEDQTLLEVETDKAVVDIPSPADGVIEDRAVSDGDTIEVGDRLVTIDTDANDESASDENPEEQIVSLDTSTDDEEREESNSVVGSISTEAEILEGEEQRELDNDVLATPSTRKLARELGVDINTVEGTGSEGRITDDDVRRAASEAVTDDDSVERSEQDDWGPVRVKSFSGTRKAIAQRMRASAFEIPQVTHMDETDVTELHEFVEQKSTETDVNLTLLPFFIKSVIDGFEDYPILNATVNKEEEEIVIKKYFNIGIGVDTEHGLMVPVVKNADEKSVLEIAEEVNRLAEECRQRTIDLDELQGGTFTITNIGFVGGKWSTPKINYPEAAIMATGRADLQPAVVDGSVEPRRMLPLSVSFDHRIMDGAEVARFTNQVADRLQDPDSFSL